MSKRYGKPFRFLVLVLICTWSLWAQAEDAADQSRPVGKKIPILVLVASQESGDAFVYPGRALADFSRTAASSAGVDSSVEGLQIAQVPALSRRLHSPGEINSLLQSLEQRSAIYTQALLRELTQLKLSSQPEWSVSCLKVLKRLPQLFPGRTLETPSGRGLVWPPESPMLMTELAKARGVLAVLVVRNDSKAGVLEKIDLMFFENEEMTRTYWSRDMHDPTLAFQTDEAIQLVARRFRTRVESVLQESAREKREKGEGLLELEVGREVDGAMVALVQTLVDELSEGRQEPLRPFKFDRDFVSYQTSLPTERADTLRQKIESEAGKSLPLRVEVSGNTLKLSREMN